jgi:hypothetical protein
MAPSGFKLLDEELGLHVPTLGDFVQINFGHSEKWRLVAKYESSIDPLWIVFDKIVSFRVQDEREILSYWSARDKEGVPISFAYEIAVSNYLSELKQGFTGVTERSIHHFLLGGQNTCLEVLACDRPDIWHQKPSFA